MTSSPIANTQMQMPTVFIHPPEEEQTPSWCCFDAAQPSSDPSDSPQNTYATFDSMETDADAEERFEYHQQKLRESSNRNAGEDSEIIEVVKVRKHRREPVYEEEEEQDTPPQTAALKHTSTLKSRASKAFRSLKGSLRSSKPRAQDVFSQEHDQQRQHDEHQRPRTPTISRRGSGILSQLFTAPATSIRSRSSVSSFEPPSRSESKSAFPSSRSSVSVATSYSRRSSIYQGTISPSEQEPDLHIRAPSPAPSTASRRFSRLNLRKVFSFSSHTESISSGRTTPTLSSSKSSSSPQTPTSTEEEAGTEEITPRRRRSFSTDKDRPSSSTFEFDTGPVLNLELGSTAVPSSFELSDARKRPALVQEDGDVSFEMRLDSLHFESLSFDADRFTAS
ncbi:hypothetical protein BDQ12DRAFT_297104 [Crucibulum laeve]|uniref:Uncharacterized protein n=1 Tax=Crucibulum laeve TaxID=68775 RepID=A0A5C3MBQ2_9AGAR|nr:hypothetical protein BDQ12DRAFT_297104 [Crucibulum laeve]